MNLIEKFEFKSNQMVIELEFEFEPCDLDNHPSYLGNIFL